MCKRLDKVTYPSPKVVNLANKLVALKINTDTRKGQSVARKYGVEPIPDIVFVDSRGRKVHEFLGFKPPDEFAKEMQTALARAKK